MTDVKRKPALLRRIAGGFATVSMTALVVGAAGALVVGGTGWIGDRAAAVEGPPPAPVMTVVAQPIAIEAGYVVERRFVGQVEAAQRTQVAFEIGGTVTAVTVEEGDTVDAGSVIARLDTRLIEAERNRLLASRDALGAQAELARRTADRQAQLNERGFASAQTLDQASLGLAGLDAQIVEIDAALAGVAVRLDKAVVTAPFAGRIASRDIDTGSAVGAGQPIVTLMEDRAPRFRVGLDPALADRLDPTAVARIEIGGHTLDARFIAILPRVDAATRTRSVLFEIDADRADTVAPFGITGTLVIEQQVADTGAWVPVPALRQGVRGLWTVMTVDGDAKRSTVAVEAVEIIHTDETRAFVRGTFDDGALLIADGPHRVVPGQRVNVATEGGEG